jgi:hypothetical protein
VIGAGQSNDVRQCVAAAPTLASFSDCPCVRLEVKMIIIILLFGLLKDDG